MAYKGHGPGLCSAVALASLLALDARPTLAHDEGGGSTKGDHGSGGGHGSGTGGDRPDGLVRAERSSAFITYGVGGEETIDTDGVGLEKISVFAYHLTTEGNIAAPTSWVPETVQTLMSNPGERVILVVVNNRTLDPSGQPSQQHDGEVVHAVLSNPDRRAEHIRQLVEVARTAHGVELNYERLLPETRPYYTTFIQELRQALPSGKKLSIVLQPKTDNAVGDRGRAVDWRAVEPFADYMRIMAYYYSYSTSPHGPVVPLDTLERLASYALNDPEQSIPRHKLSIILSMWGWDWPLPEGTEGTLVQYDEMIALARSKGVKPRRDPEELSLSFFYTADDRVKHEVWIDDRESLLARADLLHSSDLTRVDFWHLATGDRRMWDAILAATSPLRLPGVNFDGGRLTDVAVFRPSAGLWLVDREGDGATDSEVSFGQDGDVPVPLDYDGDGRTDFAVFRPSYGGWLVSTDGGGGTDLQAELGEDGEIPVPADYDGDGRADFAVFDTRNGGWLIDRNRDGTPDQEAVFGAAEDIPTPGDYDGDGMADLAVFHPADGQWQVDTDRDGAPDLTMVYGQSGDLPISADYDGDGKTDLAVFRPSNAGWFVDTGRDGGTDISVRFGQDGDVPVPGHYDGDGIVDFAVYRPSYGGWFIDTNRDGGTDLQVVNGAPGDVPLRENGWILDALGLTR